MFQDKNCSKPAPTPPDSAQKPYDHQIGARILSPQTLVLQLERHEVRPEKGHPQEQQTIEHRAESVGGAEVELDYPELEGVVAGQRGQGDQLAQNVVFREQAEETESA